LKQATTSRGRRIAPGVASPLLLLCVAASALVLVYSRSSSSVVLQVLAMLVAIVVVFFASHPLGHFFLARAYGVGTEYFFVGKSDFRKLPSKAVKLAGGLMPTIGTKLKKDELAKLPPRKRGYVFGAGVIVSNGMVGTELLYVLAAGFSLPAVLIGALFFVVMLATEVLFSTKVGDLSKMSNEFKKQAPSSPPSPRTPP
jgi:hypothetical protein